MAKPPWVKWYPSDFLNGIADMAPNEGYVYTFILNRIYDNNGPIKDDPSAIARRCNMRKTSCEKALKMLVEADKVYRENGLISNRRAESEIQTRQELSNKSAQAAHTRWNKSPEKPQNTASQDMHPQCDRNATAMPTRDQKLELDNTHTLSARERGDFLSTDWKPDEADRMHAGAYGLSIAEIDSEGEKFRDYWTGEVGDRSRSRNWHGRWKRWVESYREDKSKGKANGKTRNSGEQRVDAFERGVEIARRVREQASSNPDPGAPAYLALPDKPD